MSRPHLAAGASPSPGSTTVGGAGAPPVVSESVHESSMSRDDLLAQVRGTACWQNGMEHLFVCRDGFWF